MVSDDWIAARSVDRSTDEEPPLLDLSDSASCRRLSTALLDDDELVPVLFRML